MARLLLARIWWCSVTAAFPPGHQPPTFEMPPLPGVLVAAFTRNRPRRATDTDGAPIPEGGRNATLASLAGSMRRRGMGEPEIRAALLATNETRCRPPLASEEVETIARSVASYPAGAPLPLSGRTSDEAGPSAPKLVRLDVGAMLTTEPAPVPWLAEPLLVRGAFTVLYGREGEGKSMVSLAVAVAVASGQPAAGFSPEAGRVLYLDAENGEREIHRRVRALGLPSGAADRLAIYATEGLDLRSDLDEIEAAIVSERPTLTVLDSFRTLWAGSENDSEEVAPVLDRLRNLGRRHDTATLLLHHTGMVLPRPRGHGISSRGTNPLVVDGALVAEALLDA